MSYKIASDAALSPPNGPAMVAFMEQFYATSDSESQHEQYLANFTPDATLIMGPKSATGSEGTSSPLSLVSGSRSDGWQACIVYIHVRNLQIPHKH